MEELTLKIKSLLDALNYVGYQVSDLQPVVKNSYAEWLTGGKEENQDDKQ